MTATLIDVEQLQGNLNSTIRSVSIVSSAQIQDSQNIEDNRICIANNEREIKAIKKSINKQSLLSELMKAAFYFCLGIVVYALLLRFTPITG